MAEQVVAEYKLQVDQAVKGLDKLQAETKQLDKDLDKAGKDGTKALDNVGKEAGTLSSGLKKLGGVIAAAFAVDRLISFGKEAVGLAAKAEGISRAFAKLNNPTLLADLRKATRGTVSDLELMQKAVQANNFKLPLDQLATLFKFATDRAIETGESVDYLVESIVLGISRKSIPILDNLGISSVQIQDEMKKTGDFAKAAFNIVEQSMQNAGDVADTTAVRMAQLATIWDNFSVTVGDSLINLGTGFAYLLGLLEEIDPVLEGQKKAAKELADAYGDDLKGAVDDMVKSNQELLESQLKVAELEESRGYQNSREAIQNINDAIEAEKVRQQFLREYIKNLKAIYDASVKVEEVTESYVRSINQLNKELKDLDTKLKDAEVGSSAFWDILDKVEKKTKELNEAVAMTKLADAFKIDEDEFPDFSGGVIGYAEEVARETDIADKLWEAHFDKLMQETDDFNKKRKKDIEEEEKFQEMQRDMNQQFFNATLSSWQTLTYAISELSRAQYDEQQRGLENLLDKGIISQEEYERRRASLAREQFKKDKEAKLIQASINTALGVTNAIATAPNIILGLVLAAAAAAAGAAEIAVIASQPVPKFKDGGLVKEHGLLKGRSHAQGGIAVEAEGNEYFMPTQPTLKNYGLLEAMRKGIEEQYIMKHYVPQMMDASIFKGMNDIGNSAHLNGLTSGFKDHNLIAAIDRDRQSTTRVLGLIYQELKTNKKRDRYA